MPLAKKPTFEECAQRVAEKYEVSLTAATHMAVALEASYNFSYKDLQKRGQQIWEEKFITSSEIK